MAVKEGAGKTRKMKAKLLGTNIVCGGGEGRVGVPPDPGAWGVANLVVGFQRLHVLHVTPCGRLLLVHSCFESGIFMDLLYEITIVCPIFSDWLKSHDVTSHRIRCPLPMINDVSNRRR